MGPAKPSELTARLIARLIDGVDDVPRDAWDRLAGPAAPFLEHDFLSAAEAGSATPAQNALARHVTLWDGERLVAAAPYYIKGDGRGEFIYDYAWYHLAHQLGIEYYPKLLSMAPFTPAITPHFLIDPDYPREPLIRAVAGVAEAGAREAGLQGVHYLFVPEDEAAALEQQGYVRRTTFQLALSNPGYADFDAFLADFKSKDRVKLKRERRRPAEHGLTLDVIEGEAISADDMRRMFEFYRRTVRSYGTGSLYIRQPTWERLARTWRHRLVLVFARDAGGQAVAGALLAHKDGILYGRHWGCDEDLRGLYFNVAYYRPIELMIERGWHQFYAGFGNAHYKHARGFEPAPTTSVHKLFDPRLHGLIAGHLARERAHVEDQLLAIGALAKRRGGTDHT